MLILFSGGESISILKEHKVIKITGKPNKITLKLDHLDIEYWSVPVIMKGSKDIYESAVTFENLENAMMLEVGDIFLR